MVPQPSPRRPVEHKALFLRKCMPTRVDGRWTRAFRLWTRRDILPSSQLGVTNRGIQVRTAVDVGPGPDPRSGFGDDVHGELEHHATNQLDPDVVFAHR